MFLPPSWKSDHNFTQFSDFSASKLSDALLGWWYRTPYDLASVVKSKYWCFSMLFHSHFLHCIYWQSKGLCSWQKAESRLKHNLHPTTQLMMSIGVGIMRTSYLGAISFQGGFFPVGSGLAIGKVERTTWTANLLSWHRVKDELFNENSQGWALHMSNTISKSVKSHPANFLFIKDSACLGRIQVTDRAKI